MIMHKARKEFTVSNLYSKIKIMKKTTIAIIQSILYLIAPYIALQLCRMNRSIVTDNLFFIFLILLTISFWFSIWKLEKALDNDSQQYNSKKLEFWYFLITYIFSYFCTKLEIFVLFLRQWNKPLIQLDLRRNVHSLKTVLYNRNVLYFKVE